MFIREKDGMIAVYRNLELMMEGKKNYGFFLCADYVIQVDPNEPGLCKFVKDRTGIFSENRISTKKVLEIINFLYESEKNSKKK